MNTRLIALSVMLGICLLIGSPVASSVGVSCMALPTVNGYPPLGVVIQRTAGGIKSSNMVAMPTFILTGLLMVYGSTPRLMKSASIVLRKVSGGLGATALAACGFFGAVSGPGVASAAAIGRIIGLEMLEQKYPRGLAVGLIAAGGTMACIIPSSIVMVVYVSFSGASVGDMFLAGFVSGFIRIIALIRLNTFFAVKRGNKESVKKTDYMAKERLKIIGDALLPLSMPTFVLGGVFSGICTATEASVVVVIYSFTPAAFVYWELTLWGLYKVAAEGVVITGVIMLITPVATSFGWITSTQDVPTLLANWLLSITSSKFLIMAFMFLLLLLLGTFMETMCIIILVTPILLSIAQALGMRVVHYGVSVLMILMVGFLAPPFSVNLFIARRVLNVKYDGAFPDTLWVILTVTTCALLTFVVPEITELPPAALK